jgi:RNA polymerase sigma-70 factor (ECF subfamily)
MNGLGAIGLRSETGLDEAMEQSDLDAHLSRIATMWTLVRQAHEDEPSAARQAQAKMLERYGGAIRRYLQGVLRDPDAADELFQEFALKFLHGSMRGADPGRGRFRDFVKGVLFHMMADHHRRRGKQGHALPEDHPDLAVSPPSLLDVDRDFLTSWRDDLLARTWSALQAWQEESKQPFFTILRFRADHPDMPSPQMAQELNGILGKTVTAANVRQLLHRSREKFADLLLDDVVHSLEAPTADQVEQELIQLNLLEYCRPALERRGQPAD